MNRVLIFLTKYIHILKIHFETNNIYLFNCWINHLGNRFETILHFGAIVWRHQLVCDRVSLCLDGWSVHNLGWYIHDLKRGYFLKKSNKIMNSTTEEVKFLRVDRHQLRKYFITNCQEEHESESLNTKFCTKPVWSWPLWGLYIRYIPY